MHHHTDRSTQERDGDRRRSDRPPPLTAITNFWSDENVGRVLAAYGGTLVAGSIAGGMIPDGYLPERFDVIGALVCLAGMTVIMCSPRGN